MTDSPQQQTPEAILAEVFNVQVPATVPAKVKQRLFTIAARDNYEKVQGKPEIIALLEHVGAIIPEKPSKGDHLNCFGVLWSRDHAVCSRCAVNLTCRAVAANFGLDTIKLSPRLLGAKVTRMPRIVPKIEPEEPEAIATDSTPAYMVYPTSDRDLELLEWLNATFRAVMRNGEIHFHISGTAHYPISVGAPDGIMEVRFCEPSAELKTVLRQKSKGEAGRHRWVLPEETSYDDAVSHINAHVTSLLDQNEPRNP